VEQLGEEYRRQVGEQTQDEVGRKLGRFLARDDVMEAAPELWDALEAWRADAPPSERLQRSRVAEATRAVRQLPVGAPVGEVVARLATSGPASGPRGWTARSSARKSREPTVRYLELVCWELVVTPEMARVGIVPDAGGWGVSAPRPEQLALG
jgi:hypothetical protein